MFRHACADCLHRIPEIGTRFPLPCGRVDYENVNSAGEVTACDHHKQDYDFMTRVIESKRRSQVALGRLDDYRNIRAEHAELSAIDTSAMERVL